MIFFLVLISAACLHNQHHQPPISSDRQVHVYEVVEETFTARNSYDNAYLDVDLWVDLTGPGGVSYRIPAFWDGGQTFHVRLVATAPGNWSWSTGFTTGDAGLDNQTGTFNAVAWTEAEKEAVPKSGKFVVEGTVIDADSKLPLHFVTVAADDQTGTVTNAKGEFQIEFADDMDEVKIQFSYFGYLTQEMVVRKAETASWRVLQNNAVWFGVR